MTTPTFFPHRTLAISALFGSLFLAPFTLQADGPHTLIRITNQNGNRPLMQKILDAGFDICAHGKNWFDAVVTPQYAHQLNQEFLKQFKKSPLRIRISNLDLEFAKHPIGIDANRGAAYHTVDDVKKVLHQLAKDFPAIAKVESVGKSFEGRDLWALKISDNVATNEKEVAALIMGCHHAREWISWEVPLYTAKMLCANYGKEEKVTQLVNNREIWIIPQVNPDGAHFSMNSQKYWRKNRRVNQGSTYVGVDLNRNYSYEWGLVGASNSPYSDTYHGTKPFSESESSAIRDLATREKFSGSISFHSYSELNLYPWGYAEEPHAPDEAVLKKLAEGMAKYNKYTPEKSSDLYPAMGDSDDYMYGIHKALAYTIELGDTFVPPVEQIEPMCKDNYQAMLHFLDKVAELSLISVSEEEANETLRHLPLAEKIEHLVALHEDTGLKQSRWEMASDLKVAAFLADRNDRLRKLQRQVALDLLSAHQENPAFAGRMVELLHSETVDHPEIRTAVLSSWINTARFEKLLHPENRSASDLEILLKN